MSFNYSDYQDPLPRSQVELQGTFSAAMQRVYMWMASGLGLTAVVAWFTARSEWMLNQIFSRPFIFFGLLIGEIVLVIAISRAIHKMAPGTALALFFVYSAINGLTLATIFLIYSLGTIYLAFGSTAITFAILSIIGFTTKQDLSNWGSYLMMGLVGLIIASVANFFFASTMLDTIITYAGLLLFLALTVYDTQRIKKMTSQAILSGQDQVVARIGVLGALRLYLDFINMFLFILRLLGRRR